MSESLIKITGCHDFVVFPPDVLSTVVSVYVVFLTFFMCTYFYLTQPGLHSTCFSTLLSTSLLLHI